MISELFETIPGVGQYQTFALIFFFAFFVGIVVWTFRAKKTYIHKMEQLPLDSSESYSTNGENNNG